MDTILLHSGREVIYACLSKIFLDIPGAGFYEMLGVFADVMAQMEDIDGDAERLLLLTDERKKSTGEDLTAFDNDIARIYTNLYCLSNSVPIYESVYTTPGGLTMQAPMEKVMRLYRQYAFDMKHYSNEPADHISYELMFMAYLAKRMVKLIQENEPEKAQMLVEAQKSFLENHLLKWAGSFAEATISRPAAQKLYAPAAQFMAKYLVGDMEMLCLLENIEL